MSARVSLSWVVASLIVCLADGHASAQALLSGNFSQWPVGLVSGDIPGDPIGDSVYSLTQRYNGSAAGPTTRAAGTRLEIYDNACAPGQSCPASTGRSIYLYAAPLPAGSADQFIDFHIAGEVFFAAPGYYGANAAGQITLWANHYSTALITLVVTRSSLPNRPGLMVAALWPDGSTAMHSVIDSARTFRVDAALRRDGTRPCSISIDGTPFVDVPLPTGTVFSAGEQLAVEITFVNPEATPHYFDVDELTLSASEPFVLERINPDLFPNTIKLH
jgi:hypothetical protein